MESSIQESRLFEDKNLRLHKTLHRQGSKEGVLV